MSCILNSDLLSCLKLLPDNSFDGVFCDPPYELGFMGKSWDSTGVAFQPETWAEVLRVCKPGAHLLAFGGSRTFHRLVCAVEDAGWEIRDVLMWLYGSGFPKSLDVSKAINKAAGAERNVIGYSQGRSSTIHGGGQSVRTPDAITAPATESARLWDGYGTALKPAYEPVVLARKPLDGTVAQNVQKWGCGALWIDGGRIGDNAGWSYPNGRGGSGWHGRDSLANNLTEPMKATKGRWPANALHDGSPEVLDGFPDTGKSGTAVQRNGGGQKIGGNGVYGGSNGLTREDSGYADSGSAARFFYCAKASTRERNAGCEGRNVHPTVKPLDLCRYLATLILPPADRPQGTRKLLVPFSGSGSEMTGAILAGWDDVTGIEREAEYVEIAKARLSHHSGKPPVVLLPEWLDL